MSPLEIVAALFGVVSVFLSVRQNIWSWPTAIVNVGLYIVIFGEARLYADSGLQVVYVVLNAYGWYHWLHGGKNRTELPVTRTPLRLWGILAGIGIAGSVLLGTFLARFTPDPLPFLDASTTTTSLIAQWMMTRKLLENWIIWVAVDVVYIGIYVTRSLRLTAVLYLVFLVLSAFGYLQWRRSEAERSATRPLPA